MLCVVEDSSLTDQIKSWYEWEYYEAFKRVGARSASDKHAQSILSYETFHDKERYNASMLWDTNATVSYNIYSSLAQIKTMERRLKEDLQLRERHADTIREDIKKVM